MAFDPREPDACTPTRVRWIVLAFVAFASASAYLTRYCISAANTTIQQDVGLNDAQMGQLMSAFMLGYLIFQVPGGWLGNRIGTRAAFVLISVLWSLCNIWTAAASLFGALWGSRFLLGAFQAGLVPLSAKIVKDWIPLASRGKCSAGVGAAMSVGGAFTLWLTGRLLSDDFDWRGVFVGYAMVSLVWSVGFGWYFRTDPRDHPGVNDAEVRLIRASDSAQESEMQAYSAPIGETSVSLAMLASASMWGLCVQSFCRAAGYSFFVTWFFAFLEYAHGVPKAAAGVLNSLPLMAVVVGSLTGGVLIDWLLRTTGSAWISRTGTSVVAMTACGLFTLASAWTSTPAQLAAVIAVGAVFSGLAMPATWAATIDIGGRHTAVAMGVMNMAGCLAGVILPMSLGAWFDTIRRTGGDWNLVIYLHGAFYLVGAVSWLAVQPDRRIDG
ncbi:MAG: MFS transporter [Planctomycetaceae bacterium]|nr:MFS transporter [Planctomycetaceae bacterium]